MTQYVELPHEFVAKLEKHIAQEEAREILTDRIFKDGSQRMDEIERDLAAISGVVKTADGFIQAVKVSSYVGGMFVALLTWVFVEKNNDIKTLQKLGNEHSVQISETIAILKADIAANDTRHKSIDAATGPGHGHAK